MDDKWYSSAKIFSEYRKAQEVKTGLCARGLFEQDKINERFFIGDQWNGVQAGTDKPLIRYNIVKRVGDYKMALIGSSALAVQYTAEGVPNTAGIKKNVRQDLNEMRLQSEQGVPPEEMMQPENEAERINLVMSAMSDYFKVTAERLKLDDLKTKALRKAYLSGTGIFYTYWDDRIKTGLYADMEKQSPIMGDIGCEVLDIENVCFGDPNMESVQDQPYIIIAQRKSVDELKRAARRNRRPASEIDAIKPDRQYNGYFAGDRAADEPEHSKKATVLTKFYKEWDDEGKTFRVMAVEVVEGATIRKPWDIQIRLYPIAKMIWEERANSAYGDSEVTHIVPNQIAINRLVTASVWSGLMNGMPIMMVNGDVVTGPVTNEPGQIFKVYGDANDMASAIRYVQPPNASGQFENLVASLVSNTLTHSGANDAALGDMRPENTSAIVALREAATMPLQLMKNRFHSFVEDIARIWAEFWVSMYGTRALKIVDKDGEWYMPFRGEDYRNLLISVRVDVGEAGLWSEIQTIQTLDSLLQSQTIDVIQYLERLPKGTVPDLGGLIQDIQDKMAAPSEPSTPTDGGDAETQPTDGGAVPPEGMPIPTDVPEEMVPPEEVAPDPDFNAIVQQLPPEYQQALAAMPPEEQEQVIQQMMGGGM